MKPYFELSKSKVLEQYQKAESLADIVSYSSKTNTIVTGILEEETDCLFSIHMFTELKNIKDKSRVLFLAQGWNEEQIKELIDLGIFRFVVDNEKDLDVLLEYLKNNNTKIELMLRAKLKENTIRTERYFVFGMPSEIINKRIADLKSNPKISSLGIHFHRKTQNMAEWDLIYEIEQMFEPSFDRIDVINIGGGLPSVYANTNEAVINSIFERITELKEYLNNKNINLMIEPGRFISAPASKLVTEIVSIHDNNIIVNASVYNTDLDAIVVPVKLLIEGELQKQGTPHVVKGCTPCSMDLFRYRAYLDNPKVGDKLIFLNAGAYNFASDFCDLEKLKTVIVK